MGQYAFRSRDFMSSMTENEPAKKLVIAIDGPSASGKGTLGRSLAQRLGYAFLETGMLYRAVGFAVLQSGGSPENQGDAERGVEIIKSNLTPELLSNPKLREDEMGQPASQVAAIPSVRQALLEFQRDFAACPPDNKPGAVLDGRDIGTVICPDADIKLYVTADVGIRSERRMKEMEGRGIEIPYEEVLSEMKRRDQRDTTREDAPLTKAEDAFVIDTSTLEPSEVLDQALTLIRARLIEI